MDTDTNDLSLSEILTPNLVSLAVAFENTQRNDSRVFLKMNTKRTLKKPAHMFSSGASTSNTQYTSLPLFDIESEEDTFV
eukprot:Awhi_evm1s10264